MFVEMMRKHIAAWRFWRSELLRLGCRRGSEPHEKDPERIVVVLKRLHTWNRSNIPTLENMDVFTNRIKDMTDILLREDVVFDFGEVRTCAGVR